jgi:hypothetical protein
LNDILTLFSVGIDVGHCLQQLDLNSTRWLEAADSESSSAKDPTIPVDIPSTEPVKIERVEEFNGNQEDLILS